MKKCLIILCYIAVHSAFSQCEDSGKLKFGGSYYSKSNNYIPFEIKHQDSIYREDTFYPFDLKKIEKYSNFILKKSKDYIATRANISFYDKLTFDELQINYPDSIKVVYENEQLYNLSNYEITYVIYYHYTNGNVQYAFGLEFDKEGNMISENQFPKSSGNSNFENIINFCDALKLVKGKRKFKNKKVDYIKLAYLDNKNTFCWLIEEKEKPNKEIGKWEEQITNSYFINANSNKLELIKENKSYSLACGIAPTSQTKKEKKSKRKK